MVVTHSNRVDIVVIRRDLINIMVIQKKRLDMVVTHSNRVDIVVIRRDLISIMVL